MDHKRQVSQMIGLTLGFVIFLVACNTSQPAPTPAYTPTPTQIPTPIPGNELLIENQKAMDALKTGRMKMTMTIEAEGQTFEMVMDGAFENPQKSFFEIISSGQKIEVVTLSQEDIFTRQAGSEVWVSSLMSDVLPDYGSQLTPGDIAESPVVAGEETLDGVSTYVVAYDIDMGKFISKYPSLSQMSDPLQSSGSGKIWIGKQDFLTRKFNLNMTIAYVGGKLNYAFEGIVGDFAKPVQIPDPVPHYDQIILNASDPVFEVVFSPDSSFLAACDDDQMIYLWSTAELRTKPKIITHPDVKKEGVIQTADFSSLAFSPDGVTLAAGTQGQVLLYSPADLTAEPKALIPSGVKKELGSNFDTVAYSPDGKLLAAGGAGPDIYIWSTNKLKAAPRVLKGHNNPVVDLMFTPDGKTLISGSEDGTIRLWSVESLYAPLNTLSGHKEDFHDLEVTPDGQYLLSVGFKDPVYAWSLTSPGNRPDSLIPRVDESLGKYPTLAIAISPDGKTVATADTNGVVRLWSLANPEKPFAILGTQSQYDLMTIAFSPDGKYLSAGSGDAFVYVWVLDGQP